MELQHIQDIVKEYFLNRLSASNGAIYAEIRLAIRRSLLPLYQDLMSIYHHARKTKETFYVHVYIYGQSVCFYRVDEHTPPQMKEIITPLYTFLFKDFLPQIEAENLPSQDDINILIKQYA